jgi:HPt (histidine-containing phosphotransfer) domain-containing protein
MQFSEIDGATIAELKVTMGADFLPELIETYLEETPQLIERLRKAFSDSDADAFRRQAHSIKSSSASLGALKFSELARELEMLGKGGDLTGASPKLEELEKAFQQVTLALQGLAYGT